MNENKKLTLKLGAFALGSFAFGFALVPLVRRHLRHHRLR